MTTIFNRQRRIKILCLTSHSPEGQEAGARLRARHIFRQLNLFGDVRVVLAGSYDEYPGMPDPVSNPSRPSEVFNFYPWKVAGVGDRLRYELGSSYLNTHGHQAGKGDCRRLHKLINEHDLIWVHGLRVANGFNIWKWPQTILDIDDIPSEVSKTEMVHGNGLEAKLRAFRKFSMWRRHEARMFERFDAITVCSGPDLACLKSSKRVFVVPNGFDAPSEVPVRCPASPVRIGFIGSLEYPPNANGLRWFLREVWPIILRKYPNTTLRVAGKCSDDPAWNQSRNVEGLGWVADSDSEVADWALTIVPIFVGGGTRVKISYAFSRKCPVVSTQLGAYGYEVTHGRELLLADSASDFASACLTLLEDQNLSARLANAAWETFLEKWTWDANAPRLEKAIRFVLERNGRVPIL